MQTHWGKLTSVTAAKAAPGIVAAAPRPLVHFEALVEEMTVDSSLCSELFTGKGKCSFTAE